MSDILSCIVLICSYNEWFFTRSSYVLSNTLSFLALNFDLNFLSYMPIVFLKFGTVDSGWNINERTDGRDKSCGITGSNAPPLLILMRSLCWISFLSGTLNFCDVAWGTVTVASLSIY